MSDPLPKPVHHDLSGPDDAERQDPFELVRQQAVLDPEFRARLAAAVRSAEKEAGDGKSDGVDPDTVIPWIDRFTAEHQFFLSSATSGLQISIDHGHRLLLLVVSVITLAVPALTLTGVMDRAWLSWALIWLGGTLLLGLLKLYFSMYVSGIAIHRRNAYYRELMAALGAAMVDLQNSTMLGSAEARYSREAEKLLVVSGIVTLLLDAFFFGAFVLGVYCLVSGIQTQ